MENPNKVRASEFIPLYGYFKHCQRRGKRGEAQAEVFANDIKNNNFYEVDVKNPTTNKLDKVAFGYSESDILDSICLKDELADIYIPLYHAALIIGLPLIIKGLENLMK